LKSIAEFVIRNVVQEALKEIRRCQILRRPLIYKVCTRVFERPNCRLIPLIGSLIFLNPILIVEFWKVYHPAIFT